MSALPILYSYFRSSASWRVRIALAYKKIDYEYRAVNLIKDGGEQKQAAYMALNPSGLVPALVIDGHTLGQSVAILEYLEESRPEPRLLPTDLFQRAVVRQMVQIIAADTQPVQNLRVLNHVEKIGGNKQEWAQHYIALNFTALETLLLRHAGRCCVGDQLSMADVCLVPQLANANRFGVDLSKFPTITRIGASLAERPEFKAAHPDNQPDKV
jgi:maleylacetoacetate isomerase